MSDMDISFIDKPWQGSLTRQGPLDYSSAGTLAFMAEKIMPPEIAIKAAIIEGGTEDALYRRATTIVNAYPRSLLSRLRRDL
jgi:hypothetical protein